jgi:hypothetical protein
VVFGAHLDMDGASRMEERARQPVIGTRLRHLTASIAAK